MVKFGEIVGKSIMAIYTSVKDIGFRAIAKIMLIVKAFDSLIGSIGKLYDIAKQPKAI